ncbi:MAG: response regulator transcription factor, partial [Ruminococcus sp.]|nr:response regulator transcription factor [Ruminococcus sp.]
YTYPVIMLTARTEDIDKISGLTLGADDYVTKPFNPLELTARIKAQLRRYKQYSNDSADNTKNDSIIEISGLEVDSRTHKCYLFGNEVFLTPTEFGILWILCENAGNVVSTEDIFEKVWGEKYLDSNNTVMVHIRRIREKLHEPSRNPRFVKTVWGVGYKIEKKS